MNSQHCRKVKASSANDHKRHAGEKCRVERQHALRRRLVLAVAEREQAGAEGAEVDHDQKKGRQRVEAEMRAEPGHAERQRNGERRRVAEQMRRRGDQRNRRHDHARAIDDAA